MHKPDNSRPVILQHIECDVYELHVLWLLRSNVSQPVKFRHIERDEHEQYVLWLLQAHYDLCI